MFSPKTILTLCAVLCSGLSAAQTVSQAIETLRNDSASQTRFVDKATLYGVGYTQLQDTYLSPEEYRGMEFRLSRESTRMTRIMGGHVSLQSYFQTNVGYMGNRADNNNTVTALANWNYGLHYQFPVTDNFRLLAGPMADVSGGFTYNMRNGNNPISLRTSLSFDASVAAVWNLRAWGKPLDLRWQADVPMVGVAFMPHYGQSYYEIFSLGNSSGTVKVTTPVSNPSVRQMLTADYPIGRLTFRVAYVCDIRQYSLNNLKSHVYSHVFMIGVVKHLFKL